MAVLTCWGSGWAVVTASAHGTDIVPRRTSLGANGVASAQAHSMFPNTTKGQAMFAPFTMATTSEVPDTFLSFNFDVGAFPTLIDPIWPHHQ
jgi:hypothetical protein